MTKKDNNKIDYIYNVRDKVKNVQYYIDLSLNRTLSMFKYENLPDSLPEIELEKILQINGYGIVTKINDEIIALWGGWCPPKDCYYRYTKLIVNNPWINLNKTFTFGEDCVLVKNDPLCKGLLPIFKRYGTFLTETDITLYLAMVNFRSIYNIIVNSDDEKDSATIFLDDIEKGKQGVLLEDDFSNGIKSTPFSNAAQGYITQIIELEQYLKGSFFNDLGLNANYNMKRERLNSSEVELNEDGLRPLIDTMLEERQKFVEEINKMYGTNIKVKYDSSWEQYNDDEEVIEENEEIKENDEIIEMKEETIDPQQEENIEDNNEIIENIEEQIEQNEEKKEITEEIIEDIKEIVEEVKEDIKYE